MLLFSKIPNSCLSEMRQIDARSNKFPLPQHSLSSSLKNYINMGAFLENKLVAFVLFRVIADEAEIIHVVCDVQEQGKGYTSKLFKHILCESKNTSHINTWHLEVRKSNIPAINLYTQLGFMSVGKRKAYYQNCEDANLMQLIKK